jgi:hypothetical protein
VSHAVVAHSHRHNIHFFVAGARGNCHSQNIASIDSLVAGGVGCQFGKIERLRIFHAWSDQFDGQLMGLIQVTAMAATSKEQASHRQRARRNGCRGGKNCTFANESQPHHACHTSLQGKFGFR